MKQKGDDACDGVDLADAHGVTLAQVLDVSILAVTLQAFLQHHPTTVALPVRSLLQQHCVTVRVCGGCLLTHRIVAHRRPDVVMTVIL